MEVAAQWEHAQTAQMHARTRTPTPTSSRAADGDDEDDEIDVQVEPNEQQGEEEEEQQDQEEEDVAREEEEKEESTSPPPTAPASGRPSSSRSHARGPAHAHAHAHASSAAPPAPRPAIAAAAHSPRWGRSASTPVSTSASASTGPTEPASAWPSDGSGPLNEAHLDSAARAAIDSGDESVVAQFLQLLETHRARCERDHRYVEAELVRDKIDSLRAHEQTARVHAMQVRHLSERLELDQAHVLEFDEFAGAWSRRMDAWDADTRARHQALLTRHVTALEEWSQAQQEQVLLRPKFSKQLLALRTMQESLARTRDYAAAERVRLQAQQLEQVELEALKSSWSARAHAQRTRFLESQARELSAWLARRNEERCKLESLKRTELRSGIVQKYANLSRELARVHAKERARLEKRVEMGVSDSPILREEAHRRNKIVLPEEVGIATGGPAPGSGSTRRGDESARASAASSTTVGGLSGTTNVRAQSHAWASRRRVQEEEEMMLRELDLEGVPTIAATMSARAASRNSNQSSQPPTPNGAASFAAQQQQQQAQVQALYPQPFSARTSAPSTPNAAPSSQATPQRYVHKSSPAQVHSATSTPRPHTSSSYESNSGVRRSVGRRLPQASQAAAHYQRPPPRVLTSRDRDNEIAAVLHRGAPPFLMQQQQQQQQTQTPPGSSGADGGSAHGPSHVRQRSYVERIAARQLTSQKVHSVFHPPLPAISPAQRALLDRERQQLEQRRLQRQAMQQQPVHQASSSDDEF